jgi:hypothetical protein
MFVLQFAMLNVSATVAISRYLLGNRIIWCQPNFRSMSLKTSVRTPSTDYKTSDLSPAQYQVTTTNANRSTEVKKPVREANQ